MRTGYVRQGEVILLPLLYHAHHSLHTEDLPFWLDLADRTGSPILELGCGTGRVSLPLVQSGHSVVGLDLDRAMLETLQQNTPPSLADRVHLLQADLTDFHLAAAFHLVLLPCNTYSTLIRDQRIAALACIREHLKKGGLFAVSLPNPTLLMRLPSHSSPEVEEIFPHPLDGEPVQVSSGWKRSGRSFLLSWHYDHLLPDGRVERLSAQVRHVLASTQTYLDEFAQAGLQVIETYGDFDRSVYVPESPSLIIIAAR